jgi:hypothetical protein
MKKIMILVLVLGLASAANAAYSYNWTDTDGNPIAQGTIGTAIVLNIDRDTYTGTWSHGFKMYDNFENMGGPGDYGDMTGAAYGGAEGSTPPAAISAYSTTYDGYDLTAGQTSAAGTDVYTGGTMFELTIMPSASGTLTIDNVDSSYTNVVDSASINIIPEPMTIALLGLGGLFLRRRK